MIRRMILAAITATAIAIHIWAVHSTRQTPRQWWQRNTR